MSTPTVASLRKSGNKVAVRHFRFSSTSSKLLPLMEVPMGTHKPHGGETHVWITTPKGQELKAKAVCSKKDSFSYATGRNIAIDRALAELTKTVSIVEPSASVKSAVRSQSLPLREGSL